MTCRSETYVDRYMYVQCIKAAAIVTFTIRLVRVARRRNRYHVS